MLGRFQRKNRPRWQSSDEIFVIILTSVITRWNFKRGYGGDQMVQQRSPQKMRPSL